MAQLRFRLSVRLVTLAEDAEVDGDRHLRLQRARRDRCVAGIQVHRSEQAPWQARRDGKQRNARAAEALGDLLEVRPITGIAREVHVAGARQQHEAKPEARVPVAGAAAAVVERREAPDAVCAESSPLTPFELSDYVQSS